MKTSKIFASAALLALLCASLSAQQTASPGHAVHNPKPKDGTGSSTFPSAKMFIGADGQVMPGDNILIFYFVTPGNNPGAMTFSIQENFVSNSGSAASTTYAGNMVPSGTLNGLVYTKTTTSSQAGRFEFLVSASDSTGALLQTTRFYVNVLQASSAPTSWPFRISGVVTNHVLPSGAQQLQFTGFLPFNLYEYFLGLPPYTGSSGTVVPDNDQQLSLLSANLDTNQQKLLIMMPDGSYSQTVTFLLPSPARLQ